MTTALQLPGVRRHLIISALILVATSYAVHSEEVPVLSPTTSLSGDDTGCPQFQTLNIFGDHIATWREKNEDPWLFIGAPRESYGRSGVGIDCAHDGAVYIYRIRPDGALDFQQKIIGEGASGPPYYGDRLGGGITIARGRLLINVLNDPSFPGLVDPNEDPYGEGEPPFVYAGKVYAYELESGVWTKTQELVSPQPGSWYGFGGRTDANATALNGAGTIAVIGETGCCRFSQKAHVFRFDDTSGQWTHLQTLDAPAPVNDLGWDAFGDGVLHLGDDFFAISATDISMTAPVLETGYLFVYSPVGTGLDPTPVQTLVSPTGAIDQAICMDQFGDTGLAIGESLVAVADPCGSESGLAHSGTIRTYEFSEKGKYPLRSQDTIAHPYPSEDAFLGKAFGSGMQAIATNGRFIVVGEPLSWLGFGRRDAYLLERTNRGWNLVARLRSPDADAFPIYMGTSVAFLGRGLIAVAQGANFDFDDGYGPSELHIFDASSLGVE